MYFTVELCTEWREHESIQPGWKMRAVEQPSGRTFFQYLAPDQSIMQSRKEMLQYIKNPPSKTEKSSSLKASVSKKKKLRKTMPKKKKLVTNQVIVTKSTNEIRQTFLTKNKRVFKKINKHSFRYEPVIFVPNLKDILNQELSSDEEIFEQSNRIKSDNKLLYFLLQITITPEHLIFQNKSTTTISFQN